MWWVLLPLSAFAQNDPDLDAIKKLEDELPSSQLSTHIQEVDKRFHSTPQRYPYHKVSLEKILNSGIEHGHIKAGRYLVRLADNKPVLLTESFYGKFFRLEDEFGFRYLQSNDGSCIYKIKSEYFNSVEPELVLYEPPPRYTPAPKNIIRANYDKKLKLLPEVTFLAGVVQGSYMRDLFNDEKAARGLTTQYGVHMATGWNLPVKAGVVLHHEKSSYKLSGGGKVEYTSTSLGPQFKSKDLDIQGYALRLQTHFRVSPLARANAQTTNGNVSFKFNSSDFLVSAEHPVRNKMGEFVLGFFFQSQWLNIKDQPEIVSIKASNEINKSFGLSFAQVFE